MNRLNSIKKSKHLNPVEPLLGILGFLLIAVFFIAFFSYLLLEPFATMDSPGLAWLVHQIIRISTTTRSVEGGEGCDIFDGNWIWDDSYLLYQSTGCSLMDNGFRCLDFYTKWRWQPKDCNFCPASGVPNNDSNSIYEVNGSPISKHRGFLVFMFKEYNCTVEYYRAPYLVLQSRSPAIAPKEVKMTLRVDKLRLLLSRRQECEHEYERANCIQKDWIGREVYLLLPRNFFFLAYIYTRQILIPWPDLAEAASVIPVATVTCKSYLNLAHCLFHTERIIPLSDVLSNRSEELQVKNLDVLNVTSITSRRKDGHPSLYIQSPKAGLRPPHIQDRSHWCLPSWNELFMYFS
ncbi:hypothetical protein Dsin_025137 [Dipteronia sinensis]|uniref:Uncharacterized protein n=1 Tax=Dipteronia sinensis TaxID=43782 RepID=A0AAD9ZVQ8_9ROSI|nr:hypothetical protein Dsin_025137 [Dipteronia sinensis]